MHFRFVDDVIFLQWRHAMGQNKDDVIFRRVRQVAAQSAKLPRINKYNT